MHFSKKIIFFQNFVSHCVKIFSIYPSLIFSRNHLFFPHPSFFSSPSFLPFLNSSILPTFFPFLSDHSSVLPPPSFPSLLCFHISAFKAWPYLRSFKILEVQPEETLISKVCVCWACFFFFYHLLIFSHTFPLWLKHNLNHCCKRSELA